jgi:hypothetical protein
MSRADCPRRLCDRLITAAGDDVAAAEARDGMAKSEIALLTLRSPFAVGLRQAGETEPAKCQASAAEQTISRTPILDA